MRCALDTMPQSPSFSLGSSQCLEPCFACSSGSSITHTHTVFLAATRGNQPAAPTCSNMGKISRL
jgi:hypothetical protein